MGDLTEAEYQQIIIAEVGDNAQGSLASMVPLYWRRRAAYADLETRALYVKRDAILLMLGQVRGQVDLTGTGGASIKQDQLTSHLQEMLTQVHDLIEQLELTGGSGGAVGELSTTAPVMPPTDSPVDANDRAYRGDPYRRPCRRMP